ncbi:hypothetical protein [Nonomuraea jabiensis]|uniref:Gram-positive cocci surface proteins LPxTG domain-containing protein n=1 Tax=Nonomuraea jabiensis TaxID=882448 RepID=A0A7W9G4D0_9ACTN|nr:hypothetical protein [Nonomuraea jabiensis]MBB5776971.1 hypothetical protein [Nonomuraea jabiensis]
MGLTGTLAIFVGSIFVVSTPTAALAAVTKQFSYACTGSLLSSTTTQTVSVGLSAPDSVTAGTTFDLTVKIPELTLATAPTAATTLQVNATMTPTPGSIQDPGAKTGANVTTSTTVPAKDVVYKVSVPTGTTGKVSVKPGQLVLSLLSPSTATTTCTTQSTEVLDVTIGTGGGGGTDDVVEYDCDVASGGGDADYPADVDIKVTMTPPTSATANADASITWTGVVQSTGQSLKAPTGFPTTSPKMFVTVKASGAGVPTTATGEATLGTVTIGQPITLPTSVTVKIKPTTTGTVTLTAGDLAFGTSASSPSIKCLAPTTGLKTFTFQVGSSTGTPTTSSTPTNTTSTPKPTKTSTATVTVTPSSSTKKSKTPKAGADTGGGGEAGPDGRMFILTGTALVGAAAVGGLVMRRRNATRG